jgi:small-conductance mechanosensitive channel
MPNALARSGSLRGRVLTAISAIALVLIADPARAQITTQAQAPTESSVPGAAVLGPQGRQAALRFWNREITTFRTPYETITPDQRVENTLQRIARLPEFGDFDVQAREARVDTLALYVVTANGEWIIRLLPGDVNPLAGETLAGNAKIASDRLREALQARAAQRNLPLMLIGVARAAAATVAMLAFAFASVFVRRRVLERLQKSAALPGKEIRVARVDARPMLLALQRRMVTWTVLIAQLTGIFLWLTYVLLQFPYTRPWGEHLGGMLLDIFSRIGLGIVNAIPGLFAVAIIVVITRTLVRLLYALFRAVESGRIELAWIQPDTARATRRLLGVIIWVFALTVAYPFIPASNTDAFKGISVLLGLMVSLGSAGVVTQVMSGLVATYSRAFKAGDYVRIGDTEGTVTDVGMLATKVMTPRREEVTIPNAVLVGTTAINYSRLGQADGSLVATIVGIGYDVPWRQVHALLICAAERTEHVRQSPPPYVRQRSLEQFYVEYSLVVSVDRPTQRDMILSELHAHVQDVFNESDVQIMSPAFESQPERPVVVPEGRWFVKPRREEHAEPVKTKEPMATDP